MQLDRKHKYANFLPVKTQMDFLLDLFDVGYENAYVSTVDFISVHGIFYHRIEMMLPNVGRLCLYQKFVDYLDEQFPCFDVFYSIANMPNLNKKIKDADLLNRATKIIYKANKFFETHPEHIVNTDDLTKRFVNNRKAIQKQYDAHVKKQYGFMQSFCRHK